MRPEPQAPTAGKLAAAIATIFASRLPIPRRVERKSADNAGISIIPAKLAAPRQSRSRPGMGINASRRDVEHPAKIAIERPSRAAKAADSLHRRGPPQTRFSPSVILAQTRTRAQTA